MVKELKLGLLPAIHDERTLKLSAILKTTQLPPIPEEWNCDNPFSWKIPTPMFANDKWGCCVIAARAHQTLRFESFEQMNLISINDYEVLAHYWREGGGNGICTRPDNGLYLLNSLKEWRSTGWRIGRQMYKIYAFAGVPFHDHQLVKSAVYLLNGMNVGMLVTDAAMGQHNNNQVWDLVANPGKNMGGHCIYIVGYNTTGPVCITWGKFQQMTWAFWDRYIYEAFAIVDNPNSWTKDSPVDIEKLNGYLNSLN